MNEMDNVLKEIGKRVELVRRHLKFRQKDSAQALDISGDRGNQVGCVVGNGQPVKLVGLCREVR
ncbi:MAG: hypothetical protein NT166_02480 [Candidatus Aminicenantes bacterium]|nr:hypothetical protein [Candidatus Aminicenantes bacterium]